VIHRHRDAIVVWVMLALFGYIFVAQSVFAFRHPWATDTERFLYFGRALAFGRVDYSEARPRE
jgi:hypothetical protein